MNKAEYILYLLGMINDLFIDEYDPKKLGCLEIIRRELINYATADPKGPIDETKVNAIASILM